MTAEQKVEAILEAALERFATQGFDGTAMPEIAERARVGMGTIYRYFATKEVLGNAVFRRWKEALGAALAEALAGPGDEAARFLAAWRRVVGFARAYPLAFQFLELHHHAPYLDQESQAVERAATAPALAFLDRAAAAGVIEPVAPALVAPLIWGALVGLVRAGAAGAVALDERAVDQAARLMWRSLAKRGGER